MSAPEPVRCISLVTDYGVAGGFVGALHAVAFGLAPRAVVLDLDHAIPPGDVRLGALRLERLLRYVPAGVHVGVVDPGVGGMRRPVALRAGPRLFVGPDNGLLLWACDAAGGVDEAVVLDDDAYLLPDRSRTFDGRDVFVPAACHLWLGRALGEIGSRLDPATLVRIERPAARLSPDGALEVVVVQVDGFGNVQFGAAATDLAALGALPGDRLAVRAGERQVLATLGSTFSDVAPGGKVILIDSDSQLAYSVNGGRADDTLGLQHGDRVVIAPATASRAGLRP